LITGFLLSSFVQLIISRITQKIMDTFSENLENG